ncbi:MAG: hypothetical protein DSY50_01660 [Desulfobulbus sp.]|nr:MAG: hypothetical protein DSY50_01660 [Desulfobulbus sp.]RUM37838.1 MAG: hypothetical protein DSY70_09100 [Desulfobulbus sp.]RUM38714.1 MAG: hypothetical protein DSY58_01750 [Desulfobulbus sp.]
MTVFCLLCFVIGAYIIWANAMQGVTDSTSTLFPLLVIVVVHLLGGGIAIYHALKTQSVVKNLHVYAYFLSALALAIKLLTIHGLIV